MKKKIDNSLILVKIVGGLGNQMFQYAAALALGKHWQCPVKVDIRFYDEYKKRDYLLDQYKSPPLIASANDVAPFESTINSLQRRLQRRLQHRLQRRLRLYISKYQPTYKNYHQPGFRFDPYLIELRPPFYLRAGYLQSEKFFLTHAQMVRDTFQLKRPLSPHSHALWEKIKAAPWPVAVHVRRGDYLTHQHIHPLCQRAYYEKAVNIIDKSSGQKATYFVFSDDIPEARALLSFIPNATFVTAHENEPWVDMNLIAACRDAIIANSSFSWWGAWLNPHPGKHIIVPRLWFGGGHIDTSDLIPSQWTSLD